MIQAILTYQFFLNTKDTGEIEPEFRPIELIFHEFEERKFDKENYLDLIGANDMFAILYHHTTGLINKSGIHTNLYTGRLKETPYQTVSYFRQEANGAQYITFLIFDLEDEIELVNDLINKMGTGLNYIIESLEKAKAANQISLISNIKDKLVELVKFVMFQIERTLVTDRLQKVALIFNNDDRIKILETLRERPISKREMKDILEKQKESPNIDLLLEPFLELNLVRRDWIRGERSKETGRIEHQGEYLFLVKDIALARVPNISLLNHLKEINHELSEIYQRRLVNFFSNYDPNAQTLKETRNLAKILLTPDVYDVFVLMRNKFFPIDKIPKVFSEFANTEKIIDLLKQLNVVTEIKDKKDRSWIFLISDITPLIFFPEYILPNIWSACKSKTITSEIARKAHDLLEVTYAEKIEF